MTTARIVSFLGVSVLVASAACGGGANDGTGDDTPSDDAGTSADAAKHDSGKTPTSDSGTKHDSGTAPVDSGGGTPDATTGDDDGSVVTPDPWTDVPPRTDGSVWVRVRNLCKFPLWIHGEGSSATLTPDDAQLTSGTSRDYVAPATWSAARVTAYVDGPRTGELEKAEITLGGGVLNYNVTYVDWLGLPLEIVGVGGNCTAAVDTTGCYAKQNAVLTGCPEPFLLQGKKCVAARSYCLDPTHAGAAYCHVMDNEVLNCASCPKAQTPDIYACSGAYSQDPRMCAAVNRGMISDPDNGNSALFYKSTPFNTYSKWVHEVCPDIYAFPYDDWQGHGGFRACSGDELRITFCPSG